MAFRNREQPPRAEDYPSSDGVPMDNEQHAINTRVYLIEPLKLWCQQTGYRAFVGGNSFVYYGPNKRTDVVGPDLYVVSGGEQRCQEKWIALLEGGLLPTLVMEFLSESTSHIDRGPKLALYRDVLRCPDYFMVDRGPSIIGFRRWGKRYVQVRPLANGHLSCSSIPLELGIVDGWVRWFTTTGQMLLTGAEEADRERLRADNATAMAEWERLGHEQERLGHEQERLRADALEEQLRRLQGFS